MKFLKVIILIVALFFSATFFATPLFAASYQHVIVFGDSLSDIGNNTWANHDLLHPDIKPGAPITNDVKGRRGSLWIQDFSAIGHYQLSDYAWAGATSMNHFTNDAGVYLPTCTASVEPCDPGVPIQIKNYIAQKNIDTQALYIIWIGGNDLFNNTAFLRDMVLNPKNFKTDFDSLSWHPASNIIKAASMLVKAGVPSENIVVINLPDLTRAPLAQSVLAGHPVLELLAKSTVLIFNEHLAEKIRLYNWWHRSHLRLVNIYPLLQQVFDDKGHDGFTNITNPCVNNSKALAAGCPGYLFYNGKHPTTQAGDMIAKFVGASLRGTT